MTVTVSPRGTRPRNRRAQIRAAATRLFYEHGYEQVSVADVAASVNVGPSALYRHYAGKADMLYDAIDDTAAAFTAMLGDLRTRDLEDLAATCARTALAYRRLGVLWQREARNLPGPQRALLRSRMRDSGTLLAAALGEARPELGPARADFLSACAVNAMNSISFHRLQLAPERFEEVLTELALRVLRYQFDETAAITPPRRDLRLRTRRDEIAEAAAALFARHGFDAVSIDDIGAAVGIAGPSIYNHFASKQDVLYEVLGHGFAAVQDAYAAAVEQSSTPEQVLRRVSDSYVALTSARSDLITILIGESRNLDPVHHDYARRAQVSYIGQWVGLVQTIRPTEDVTVSRIKVQAAQMMANSLGRTTYLRDRPGFDRDVTEICWLLQQ